jgi:polyribonucleotide nucleotidyltransferase
LEVAFREPLGIEGGGDRGPRREGGDRPERDSGPEPEFAPAFLTRDDD